MKIFVDLAFFELKVLEDLVCLIIIHGSFIANLNTLRNLYPIRLV